MALKRSRSGCHTCRTRRIKCDENRPTCNNCSKRGITCTYEIRYQWIDSRIEVSTTTDADDEINLEINGKPTKQVALPSGSISEDVPRKRKQRHGPTSHKRKIGQTAVDSGCFKPAMLKKLTTVMDEIAFDSDDDPITALNGPGSITQFKKFRIRSKKKKTGSRSAVVTDPILLHSPLLKPIIYDSRPLPSTFSLDNVSATATTTTSKAASASYSAGTSIATNLANASENSRIPTPIFSAVNGPVNLTIVTPTLSQESSPSASMLSSLTEVVAPVSARPSEIYHESSSISARHMHARNKTPINSMTESDFFDHYVEITADTLVPIPYEENPFLSLLPRLAYTDETVYELLVAYGASHKYLLVYGLSENPGDMEIIERLVRKCMSRLHNRISEGRNDEIALLSATILAALSIDTGRRQMWRHCIRVAVDIMKTRQSFTDWYLDAEVISMSFRLIGYTCSICNLVLSDEDTIDFPLWPQWSGNLDFLTGIDLNLLPMFSETAELIQHLKKNKNNMTMTERAHLNVRALRVMQRMNDYWIDEFWPDSEITAMCIMFQEALQIHVLRRVLGYSTDHPIVQRIVSLAMSHLEKFIPPASAVQRCMAFILLSVASEALVPEHRTSLMIRFHHMMEQGSAYNLRTGEVIRKHWNENKSYIEHPEVLFL